MADKLCNEMRVKRIKVIYKVRTNNRKSIWSPLKEETIPKIQMEGKWLEAIGFQVGDPLTVEYGKGYIKICHAKAQDKLEAIMVAEPVAGYQAVDKSTSGRKRNAATTEKKQRTGGKSV